MSKKNHYLIVSCRRKSEIVYSYWMGDIRNSYNASSSSEMAPRIKFLWDNDFLELRQIQIHDPEELCDFLENYVRPSVKPCFISDYKEAIKESHTNMYNYDILCFMYDEASNTIYRGWVNSSKNLVNQNIVQL